MRTRTRDREILDQLWRLTAESRLHLDVTMQDLMELSLPQFLVLRAVGETRRVPTPTYVARTLGCSELADDTGYVFESLDDVEKERLLALLREGPDSTVRRAVWTRARRPSLV